MIIGTLFSDLVVTLNVTLSFSCSMSPSVIPAGLESKWTFISDALIMSAATEDADQRPAEAAVVWSCQGALIPGTSFCG